MTLSKSAGGGFLFTSRTLYAIAEKGEIRSTIRDTSDSRAGFQINIESPGGTTQSQAQTKCRKV